MRVHLMKTNLSPRATVAHPIVWMLKRSIRAGIVIFNYLFVKRTSDGTGGGTISGGTTYQQITDTDQSFFTGTGGKKAVTIEFKLDNVSVQIPFGTYTTSVIYTIVDTS